MGLTHTRCTMISGSNLTTYEHFPIYSMLAITNLNAQLGYEVMSNYKMRPNWYYLCILEWWSRCIQTSCWKEYHSSHELGTKNKNWARPRRSTLPKFYPGIVKNGLSGHSVLGFVEMLRFFIWMKFRVNCLPRLPPAIFNFFILIQIQFI